MSCEDCTKKQEEGKYTFVRIGNANVLVSGCDKHLRELMEKLR